MFIKFSFVAKKVFGKAEQFVTLNTFEITMLIFIACY